MKKLILAAGAVAMVSGAFAASGDPLVYNYKATVKHMYLKEVPITIKSSAGRLGQYTTEDYVVYQKFQKQASLKGYLIMDDDGATSQAIVSRSVLEFSGNANRQTLKANENSNPATGFDFGRNRGFLVVLNTSLMDTQEKQVQYAKVLPAVLDAKWIDTAFGSAHTAKSGDAEGTLYVGGDMVATSRYFLDRINYADRTAATYKLGTGIFERGNSLGGEDGTYARITADTTVANFYGTLPPLPVGANATYTEEDGWKAADGVSTAAGMGAIADYRWTSLHLFGWYNGPNWFDNGVRGPFDNFETVWDLNLPPDLQIGFAYYHPYFHDTWMNGAGFGRWTKDVTKTEPKRCCGRVKKGKVNILNAPVLESLAGNLKGGLFICTENGIDAEDEDYTFFDDWDGGRGGWEDQFVTARLALVVPVDGILGEEGTYRSRSDRWQNDMWNDGSLQQETTDVISGSWQIQLNTKFLAVGGVYEYWDNYFKNTKHERALVTEADINNLTKVAQDKGATLDGYVEAAYGLEVLVGTIKAAVLDLSPKAVFINGNEISDLEYDYQDMPSQIPTFVPAITPAFSSYYGLGNWKMTVAEPEP